MYFSSKRTIDAYTLSFNVFTVDDPDRICRNIEITKDNKTVTLKYPYVPITDIFEKDGRFFKEVMDNHLSLLVSHQYHALSYAQIAGL